MSRSGLLLNAIGPLVVVSHPQDPPYDEEYIISAEIVAIKPVNPVGSIVNIDAGVFENATLYPDEVPFVVVIKFSA